MSTSKLPISVPWSDHKLSKPVPYTDANAVMLYIAGICLAFFILGATAIALCIVYKRRSQRRRFSNKKDSMQEENPLYGSVDLLTSPSSDASHSFTFDRYELKWAWLELLDTVGEGEFGRVVKARVVQGSPLCSMTRKDYVAVKMLKENPCDGDVHSLRSEINLLKDIGHHRNIASLIGCCTANSRVALVMDYCPLGDLKRYLQNYREKTSYMHLINEYETIADLDLSNIGSPESSLCVMRSEDMEHTLLSFASQIASAMSYLQEQKFVHRDLAARNILVYDRQTVKVSDFGLSRDIYETNVYKPTSTRRLPYRWMALEAINDFVFTVKSDVWSFGVVLWEIMTYGQSPYPGLCVIDLYNTLRTGYRMPQPDGCPDTLYEMMLQCWHENPVDRPNFRQALTLINTIMFGRRYQHNNANESTYHRLEESSPYENMQFDEDNSDDSPAFPKPMYMYRLTITDITDDEFSAVEDCIDAYKRSHTDPWLDEYTPNISDHHYSIIDDVDTSESAIMDIDEETVGNNANRVQTTSAALMESYQDIEVSIDECHSSQTSVIVSAPLGNGNAWLETVRKNISSRSNATKTKATRVSLAPRNPILRLLDKISWGKVFTKKLSPSSKLTDIRKFDPSKKDMYEHHIYSSTCV